MSDLCPDSEPLEDLPPVKRPFGLGRSISFKTSRIGLRRSSSSHEDPSADPLEDLPPVKRPFVFVQCGKTSSKRIKLACLRACGRVIFQIFSMSDR